MRLGVLLLALDVHDRPCGGIRPAGKMHPLVVNASHGYMRRLQSCGIVVMRTQRVARLRPLKHASGGGGHTQQQGG